MGSWVNILFKAAVIALVAALVTGVPMAILLAWDIETSLVPTFISRLIGLAMLGSFAVGLPIALIVFFLAGSELAKNRSSVFIAANLAGVMLLITTALLGGMIGAVFYGLPSLVAANVFGALGWLWILKPMRASYENA